MPAAAQRRRDAWIGLDRVTEERGLKMGGWYAMIIDAGSESASSATRVVRLLSIDRGSQMPVPVDARVSVSFVLTQSSARYSGSDAAAVAQELLLDIR